MFPSVEYKPEQFPSLARALVFSSGKMVCTDAKKESEVHKAVEKLKQMLEDKELIHY